MEDYNTGKTNAESLNENDLVALLASLRLEATPEANFEERFLYDFHERVAREAVCRPARKLLWEHIRQFLSNFGGRKLAYGASTLGAGALALGLYSLPDERGAQKVAAIHSAIVGQMENSMAALKPGAAQEFTSIAVGGGERKSFTRDRLAVAQNNSSFYLLNQPESDVLYVSSSQPVNMGLSSGLEADFPTLTTNLAL